MTGEKARHGMDSQISRSQRRRLQEQGKGAVTRMTTERKRATYSLIECKPTESAIECDIVVISFLATKTTTVTTEVDRRGKGSQYSVIQCPLSICADPSLRPHLRLHAHIVAALLPPTAAMTISLAVSIALSLLYDDFHAKLCGIPSSEIPTTAHRYFILSYRLQTLVSRDSHRPEPPQSFSEAVRRFLIFETQQTAPRRAFFNLQECTTTHAADHISLVQTGRMFVIVRVDFNFRCPLITLKPGCNSSIAKANVYKNRRKYS